MTPIIRKSMQARCDLVDIADYLEQVGGLASAERFLAAVEQALGQLAGLPKMGSPWETSHPRLQGLRTWPVPGFRNHVIFYRPLDDGIDLLRVLHGSRDTNALLHVGSDPA